MFGLPFLIAPAEAEAQCAWLDENRLVDGVVTDDSDVFLFGGRCVYRRARSPPPRLLLPTFPFWLYCFRCFFVGFGRLLTLSCKRPWAWGGLRVA